MAFNSFIHTVKTICSSEANAQKSLERELIQEIDNFISDRNKDALVVFVEQGYRFNAKQALTIMKEYYYFSHDVIRKDIYSLYDSQFKELVSNNLQEMTDFSNLSIGKKKRILKFKECVTNNHAIFHYLSSDTLGKSVLTDNAHTIEVLNVNKALFKYLDKEYDRLRGEDNVREYRSTVDDCKTKVEETIKLIETIVPGISKEDIQLKLAKYTSVLQNFNSLKDDMMQDIIKNIKNFDEASLPLMATKAIYEIRSNYKDIDKTKLSMSQNLELENLYKTRFPQVIEEYVTISPRYRAKLKGHNENPDDLLIESLNEIQNGIGIIFESLQEKSHDRMKITHKYLKSKL